MLVVADASPLIFLDRLGHLSLLPSLYDRVVVPQAVLDEVAAGAGEIAALAELGTADWVEVGRGEEEDEALRAA